MTDREKVIKAVECRKNVHKRCGNPCERTGNCKYAACVRSPDGEPYYPFYCDTEKLCTDILSLLHEQEPVMWSYDGYNCFKCSNCDFHINDEVYYLTDKPISFCPGCGRKLKWDAKEGEMP